MMEILRRRQGLCPRTRPRPAGTICHGSARLDSRYRWRSDIAARYVQLL